MNFKILTPLALSLTVLTACGSNPKAVPAFHAEKDESSELISEAELTQTGCAFIETPETKIQCETVQNLGSLYAQRLAQTRYYQSNRDFTGSDDFQNANPTTRLALLLKQGKMMGELVFNSKPRETFWNFPNANGTEKTCYNAFLILAADDRIFVDLKEVNGSSTTDVSGPTAIGAKARKALQVCRSATSQTNEAEKMKSVLEAIETHIGGVL